MSNEKADSAIYPLALAGSTKITITAISISAVEIPLLLHMYHNKDYVAYIALLAYYNSIL